MRIVTLIILWTVRVAGIVQLTLGALFWAGTAISFIPLHIRIGYLIVLCLWTMATVALVTRVGGGLAIFALLWGIALPAVGLQQAMILVGPMHWIIRVIHLLMGLTALGLADRLAGRVLASTSAAEGKGASPLAASIRSR